MTPTRPWTLLAVAAACAVAAWLFVRSSAADLPTLPWTGAPALVVLAAVAEAWPFLCAACIGLAVLVKLWPMALAGLPSVAA